MNPFVVTRVSLTSFEESPVRPCTWRPCGGQYGCPCACKDEVPHLADDLLRDLQGARHAGDFLCSRSSVGHPPTVAHAWPVEVPVRQGEVIHIDYGAIFGGYHTDRARNFVAILEQDATKAREEWRVRSADLTQVLRLDPRVVVWQDGAIVRAEHRAQPSRPVDPPGCPGADRDSDQEQHQPVPFCER